MENSQQSLEAQLRQRAENWYLGLISGRQGGVPGDLARGLLAFASALYRFGLFWHRLYYRLPWTTYRMPAPIISVGNLTVGGTGKTPMTALVAKKLLAAGRRPGIASRGYMAGAGGTNEELALLAEELSDVPHVQSPDRIFAVQQLIKEHGCNVVILDDGFQHWPLRRDVDIVLVDALQPFGYGHLLPRGLLREPPASLRRADLVVLTRADQVDEAELERLKRRLQGLCRPEVAVLVAKHQPGGLRMLDGSTEPVEGLRGKPIIAACGIGNPDAFRKTLVETGARVISFVSFGDHHRYTEQELASLFAQATARGANMVVTTTKDFVKWKRLLTALQQPKAAALEVRIRLLDGDSRLDEFLAHLAGGRGQGCAK